MAGDAWITVVRSCSSGRKVSEPESTRVLAAERVHLACRS